MSSGTASEIRSAPEPRLAVLAAAFCLGCSSLAAAGEPQRPLAEAARENRARVEASRKERGPAPRFTDASFAGLRPSGPAREQRPVGADRPAPAAALPPAGEGALAAEDGEDSVHDPTPPRDTGEREAELRERLLDIEASLAAIGASGLPFAPRNPNRFQSPLDAARLRAEQEELRRELAELRRRPPDR